MEIKKYTIYTGSINKLSKMNAAIFDVKIISENIKLKNRGCEVVPLKI